MGIVSKYKRSCDKGIGGCGRIVDAMEVVTVEKGMWHLCKRCAGKLIGQIYELHHHGYTGGEIDRLLEGDKNAYYEAIGRRNHRA